MNCFTTQLLVEGDPNSTDPLTSTTREVELGINTPDRTSLRHLTADITKYQHVVYTVSVSPVEAGALAQFASLDFSAFVVFHILFGLCIQMAVFVMMPCGEC